MLINMSKVKEYIDLGYISMNKHPIEDIFILNYTNKCTFDLFWNDITKQCRGLIVNKDGEILSRCLPKFFNLGEIDESKIENLPNTSFDVYEKLDGSMGISFSIDNDTYISTRGSFASDQAKWANDFIKSNPFDFNLNYTYIFEIIYKENRIVKDYKDFEGLVLLTIIDKKCDQELSRSIVENESKRLNIPIAKMYSFKSIDEILCEIENWDNLDEGFVVKFKNNHRIKIKSLNYLRVFKIVKGISKKTMWKSMVNGFVSKEFLKDIPEEFKQSINLIKDELELEYKNKFNYFHKLFLSLPKFDNAKDLFKFVKGKHKNEYPALMNIYRNKSIDEIIYKKIKPKITDSRD